MIIHLVIQVNLRIILLRSKNTYNSFCLKNIYKLRFTKIKIYLR